MIQASSKVVQFCPLWPQITVLKSCEEYYYYWQYESEENAYWHLAIPALLGPLARELLYQRQDGEDGARELHGGQRLADAEGVYGLNYQLWTSLQNENHAQYTLRFLYWVDCVAAVGDKHVHSDASSQF